MFSLYFLTTSEQISAGQQNLNRDLHNSESHFYGKLMCFFIFSEQLSPFKPNAHRWEKEFWEDYFACDLTYKGPDYHSVNPDYLRSHRDVCSGREEIDNVTFSSNPYVINTINAVYVYAFGLAK